MNKFEKEVLPQLELKRGQSSGEWQAGSYLQAAVVDVGREAGQPWPRLWALAFLRCVLLHFSFVVKAHC